MGKPALAANCALMSACSTALYGNLMYLDDIRMIPSHTAGMARLRVDWHTPSRWNAPVARNHSVVSTCVGTDNPWLLAVLHSRAGRSSAQINNIFKLESYISKLATPHCQDFVLCRQLKQAATSKSSSSGWMLGQKAWAPHWQYMALSVHQTLCTWTEWFADLEVYM